MHLLTFRVSAELSVNFHQLSVQPQDLLPTCVNSLFVSWTFRHLPLTICTSIGPSKNIPCTRWTFRQLQATFRAVAGPSGNSQCGCGTFPQVASTFRAAVVPSATFRAVTGSSVNFLSGHRSSVNFHQLSVPPRDFPSTSVNSPCGHRPSVNFRQISVLLQDLCLLLLNCRSSGFRQLSLLPCFHAFCQLTSTLRVSSGPSTFCASEGHSVNFSQLSVRPRDLPPTFSAA